MPTSILVAQTSLTDSLPTPGDAPISPAALPSSWTELPEPFTCSPIRPPCNLSWQPSPRFFTLLPYLASQPLLCLQVVSLARGHPPHLGIPLWGKPRPLSCSRGHREPLCVITVPTTHFCLTGCSKVGPPLRSGVSLFTFATLSTCRPETRIR